MSNNLVSKTLFDKMKFIKEFEQTNEEPPNMDSPDPLQPQKEFKETQIVSENVDISRKYADFLLASSNSSEPVSFRSEKSDLFAFLKKFEAPEAKDYLTLSGFEAFLIEIGVPVEENNQIWPDFLVNLHDLLTLTEKSPDSFISLPISFQVLLLLLQEKVQVNRIAALIQGTIENQLKSQGITEDFNLLREERGLWSVEKLVIEFRAIINSSNEREVMPISDNQKLKSDRQLEENKEKSIERIQKESNEKKEGKSRYEMLFAHAKYLKEKQEMAHALKYMQDLHQYSFKPTIKGFNKTTQQTTKVNIDGHKTTKKPLSEKSKRKEPTEPQTKDPIKSVQRENKDVWLDECFDRLYVNSKLKHQREEKYKELHQKTQQDSMGCTFKPQINKNQYFSNNDSGQMPIKGYEETVKRMEDARKEKEKVQRIYEEPMLRFPKNKKYMEERETNYTVPEPFNFKAKNEKDVLMFVDVELGGGKIGRIGIHKGEDLDQVVRNFSKVYTLNKDQERKLAGNLKKQLENFYRSLNEG